ncbi:MAG: hypothetical protein PHH84_04245 [Oscillospiraceae bacterium]|nr:hypothetical protein [Oscillospiraceae bacterium]
MSKQIMYPREVSPEEALSQRTLDRLTSVLFEWQQGPGNIGGLNLHGCWGTTSVLDKRYQGQTVSTYYYLLDGIMTLYDRTNNPRWKRLADDVISNILFLQCTDGGFRHAAAEFEPVYTSNPTCPIHQCLPILALLDYASWEHADKTLKDMIRPAVDKHWNHFNESWLSGTRWQSPLKYGGGWCGVTNQDLVAVAALTKYGRLYGDFSRYEEFGKKALDAYFSPVYYHEKIGLFERGDGPNFAERTPYYHIILEMLRRIYDDVGDQRIPGIIDNICLHLFDAAYVAPDGHTHLAWGAKTDSNDKSRVLDWIRTPIVFGSYNDLIENMQDYLNRNYDPEKDAVVKALMKSFSAYIFDDGSIPSTLFPKNPILSIAATPNSGTTNFWRWLIKYLGENVKDPEIIPTVGVCRTIGKYTWKSKGTLWSIECGGKRVYGGYKPLLHGITLGEEETPACGDFNQLDEFDVTEVLPNNITI